MKKLILLAAVMSLAAGCEANKKKTSTPTASTDLSVPAPQPYIPPAGASTGMNSMGTSTTITPVDSSSMSTPSAAIPMEPTPSVSTPAPAPRRSTPAPSASASSGSSVRPGTTYTVKAGDTLSEIAHKVYGKGNLNKGVAAIKKANGLKSDVIRVGQKLKVPAV